LVIPSVDNALGTKTSEDMNGLGNAMARPHLAARARRWRGILRL